MKIKLIIACCFYSLVSFAQGEANIWYFGKNAGLDFNSGSPVALTDGQLNTQEGCATLADAGGKLLFYTDGITIYNKNHNIMVNGTGLMGHSSSTQSATIVPKPGSSTLFYVFIVDYQAHVNGFRYSVVDISLDGGLGAVTADKNVLIYTPTCEKISIVKHSNNKDFWIITHGYDNDLFYAHLLTSSGLNAVPITSKSGINVIQDSFGYNAMGYMKISPNGSKLVLCHQFLNTVELFDFNTTTGVISNPITLMNSSAHLYGAEFSSNSNVLYVATTNGQELNQFDLTSTNIPSSKQLIATLSFSPGALQLGPDKKIYIAEYYESKLSVINAPDVLGVGCDLIQNSVDLGGKICFAGLPAFNQSFFFNSEIQFANTCLGESTQFELTTTEPVTSAIWDFGDGTTSTDINSTHTYLADGTFTVSVIATGASGNSSTKTRDIVISKVPTATQPQNMLICDDNNDGFHTFDLTTQNTSILNGQDPSLYKVNYFVNNVAIALPSTYTNSVAYQQETITAEVSNIVNIDCKSSTTFIIDVFNSPLPESATAIMDLTSCDNTSVGTDNDGKIVFDLTERATTILKGQSATQFLISYYKDAGFTQGIAIPAAYQNTNATETIFVKVANKDNLTCVATTSFKIEVFALPVITAVVDLKQCDDDIDGFSIFNLEQAIAKITTNASNETIGFFTTLADAQNNTNPISNQTSYTNLTVSNDAVYVRVSNANNCFRIAKLNLIISTTQIPLNFSKTFAQCDDLASGTNTDGIAAFDFSSVTGQIQAVFPAGQLLEITYYRNLNDALAEKNTIADISNYSNIGYPNSQKVYIRVDSKLNNDCLGLGAHITLNVEPIPIAKSLVETHCDDDQDGLFAFDTSTIQSQILNGLTDVTVSYLDQNNILLSNPLPNPFVTASQIVKVKVTNNTAMGCSYDATIAFVVDDLPEAFAIPVSQTTVCDDEIDPTLQDGKYSFDTSTFQSTILGNQTGMIVNYFDANGNALTSPLPNPFATATQDVKVEVINPLNLNCIATTVIPFKVNPVPAIQLTGEELVCSDLPTFTKVINAGLLDETQKQNYTYTWTLDGNLIIGESQYDLSVNKKGVYKVETINNEGCSRTRTITVNASDKATVKVDIVDLSSENSITVLATGAGDYVFSLDDEFGEYQNNNEFTNVSAGIHTVFVKDLNGCGIVPKEVAVLGIPHYFTPNQDGYNDTWNLKGINTVFNAKTTIRIFDRYGKLIKEINPMGEGWDGTYIGQPMPSSDYWYSIQLEDGRVFKGHFALKR